MNQSKSIKEGKIGGRVTGETKANSKQIYTSKIIILISACLGGRGLRREEFIAKLKCN